MTPLRERRVTLGGVRTRVLEIEGAGPPLILLHGYSDSADTWRPLLRAPGLRGRRAVAVDLQGFGRADRLAPAPVLPQLDRFVAAVVRHYAQGGRAVIVGNSLGGVAGLRAAQDERLPLVGTVAIAPAGLGHQRWVDVMEREPVLHRIATAPLPLPMALVRWGVRQGYRRLAVADPARSDPEAMAAYAAQYRGRADVTRVLRDARGLLGELRAPFDLARMVHPILLVWGTRDRLVPSRGARLLLDAVPGSELELLHGVGHCVQVEEPARVAELVGGFADKYQSVERKAC